MTEADDSATRIVYDKLHTSDLIDIARAFELDMKGVTGKPSVHFAAHRLVLIVEVLARRVKP